LNITFAEKKSPQIAAGSWNVAKPELGTVSNLIQICEDDGSFFGVGGVLWVWNITACWI
jgi:hypothetical protein